MTGMLGIHSFPLTPSPWGAGLWSGLEQRELPGCLDWKGLGFGLGPHQVPEAIGEHQITRGTVCWSLCPQS